MLLRRRRLPMQRLNTGRRTLIWCGAFLLLFCGYLSCLVLIGNSFDRVFLLNLAKIRNSVLGAVMYGFTCLGSVWGVVSVLALCLIFLNRKKLALPLIAEVTASWMLNEVVKNIVKRPRPEFKIIFENGYSFASGHAVNNTVLYVSLFLLLIYVYKISAKKLWPILLIPAIISFSRLYFAVHYLTDVLAGICFGLMVVMIFVLIYKKIFKNDFIKLNT